jgi:hypothetical protein
MFIGGSCAKTYKKPMRARSFLAFLSGFLALLAAAPIGVASAQPFGPPPPYYRDPRDGVQPLDRLLPGIRRAHPGDFYDAEGPTYGPEGDPHYHLKWMTPDGRIIWYDTDARSGRVLRASPGRDSFDAHQGPPPPGYGRRFAPGGVAPGYSYGPRFTPRYSRPYGGMGGGGRWRH